MRICSLLPSATEIVFALGLGSQLEGVTHECDYPPEARTRRILTRSVLASGLSSAQIDEAVQRNLAKGGPIYRLDEEALREADPDVVLTQELCKVCAVAYDEVIAAVEHLPRRPVVVNLEPRTLGDVLATIEEVAQATGASGEAGAVASSLRARLDAVAARVHDRERPQVVCLEWLDPLMAAGHWVPEMVELAGGRDLLGKMGAPSRRIEWSEVVEAAPEVAVLMPCGFDAERARLDLPLLERLSGWRDLPAVRHGRVYPVDASSYFSRPGPRLVDGVEILAALLHPESRATET
ncbi:MAG: cobalamin-binding protein [Chloroflexi bacterium]|nr:cobalamin-binding protein [Chloroflexota bacterium]